MDAATRLARSWEVPANIMHVPQKRAGGVLELCEKRLCRVLDTGVNRTHGVKPFVASPTPWNTSREALNPCSGPSVSGDTRLAPAVRPSLELPRSAGRRDLQPARDVSSCASSTDGIFTPSNTLAESRAASNSVG
jgi:hypothetical protein